jgi:hypothetical protein
MLHHVDVMQVLSQPLVSRGSWTLEYSAPDRGIGPLHMAREIEEEMESIHLCTGSRLAAVSAKREDFTMIKLCLCRRIAGGTPAIP